jgi:mannose-1-phosphate guanylyltransferase/mannose-6-phosphate isomerase
MIKKLEGVCAVVLAGGRGVRFWPLSRENRPKQFLKIFDKDSLLASTIKRIKNLVTPNQIYVITNRNQSPLVRKELKRFRIPSENILIEQKGKNTAPAIGWAAMEIKKRLPEAIMVVLPCDHLVKNVEYFYKDLIRSIRAAGEDRLVVFGVKPTRAETGYGYIKSNKDYSVEKFIEKPNKKLAARLIKTKRTYWNSGMFVWKADKILKEIKLHNPDLFKTLAKKKWTEIKPVSIDVAVLEKSRDVVMVPAHFVWNDLGGWRTWSELMKKDKFGNYFSGNCKDLDSRNITVLSEDKKVVTLGLKDLIIINARDGLLVCHKDKTEDIKKLIG